MQRISEKELLQRLDALDEETLLFLSKYSAERQRLARASTVVSALIATIAGFALTATTIFPNSSVVLIGVVSAILGAVVAGLGIWERRREELRLISRLLNEAHLKAKEGVSAERKRELIERFLKAEGL